MTNSHTSNTYNNLIGSVCVAMGVFLFSSNYTVMKLGHQRGLTVAQMLLCRFVVQSAISVSYWVFNKPDGVTNWYGDEPHIINIWVRGFCFSVAVLSSCYAYIVLPIGDAGIIIFQAPLLTAVLSRVLLKETLPKTTPIIVSLAVTGIVFICQPSFLFEKGAVALPWDGVVTSFVVLVSLSFSSYLVRTAPGAHFIQLEVVGSLQTTLLYIPLMMASNQLSWHLDLIGTWHIAVEWSLDIVSVLMCVGMAFIGFGGLFFYVTGYQYAQATQVAWVEYINLVFLFMFQILIFHDIPNAFDGVGVTLVVLSCATSVLEEVCKMRKQDAENCSWTDGSLTETPSGEFVIHPTARDAKGNSYPEEMTPLI